MRTFRISYRLEYLRIERNQKNQQKVTNRSTKLAEIDPRNGDILSSALAELSDDDDVAGESDCAAIGLLLLDSDDDVELDDGGVDAAAAAEPGG